MINKHLINHYHYIMIFILFIYFSIKLLNFKSLFYIIVYNMFILYLNKYSLFNFLQCIPLINVFI